MKKSLVLLVLVIFLASFVFAESNNSTGLNTGQVKTVANNLAGGLNDRTEDVLAGTVSIPSSVEVPAKVIFGINNGITWQQLIVLLGVWLMIFLVVFSTLGLTPFGDNGVIKFFIAIIVTTLMSITNSFSYVTNFFLDIAGFMTGQESSWKTVVAVIIALVLIVVANILTRIFKNQEVIATAQVTGLKTGTAMKKINIEAGID